MVYIYIFIFFEFSVDGTLVFTNVAAIKHGWNIHPKKNHLSSERFPPWKKGISERPSMFDDTTGYKKRPFAA